MILKLDRLTVDVVRALEKFLASRENQTAVARWEYHHQHDSTTGKWVGEPWFTFEEECGAKPLVEVLEPIAFDQRTGFFRVTLEIRETATSCRAGKGDERTNMRMLTLRAPLLRLLAVLGLFPEPPAEKRVDGNRPSYEGYALPAPVPLLAKPKEEGPAADGKAAAPAQS